MRIAPALLVCIAFSVPHARAADALDRAAAQAASAYVAEPCHVGLSVVAISEGRVRHYAAGSVRRDMARLPAPDSVYELASLTKTFTGALAARAVQDDRIPLDADFRAYLPEPYPNLAGITLRMLAAHTSGLQRDLPDTDALLTHPDYDRLGEQLTRLNLGYDRARTLQALHEVKLRDPPGQQQAYSNLGIRVIAYGLEQVQDASFAQLLATQITGPLEMTETLLAPTPAMQARLITPYNRHGHRQPFHDDSAGAAYGLYSTPRDMARYLAWQLDESDPVVARAHAPIRGTRDDGEGMIWHLGRDHGARMLWHGGGGFGTTSQMVLYPDLGEGFVLLSNDACAGSEEQLRQMAMALHAASRNSP
ncbi:hypothetical protein ARC20_02390 [Stenotrophomonas panacihumi]|uniref:Beta-lactamase-related domain-containing protein n=1 Tax=Stenotrophomonas panacihumi TaxID=676599 RepID=A0A0R0B635_9GAMM|nr:serine hydrolase domain-containing protein [Stenotrophomonas panacihumi]KRG49175.1 hypothetical protein ARC20_02390 [Stenotrophomonas panacihumi]PTN53309.1 hypothetical protein C9J98_16235 [Stenotrophomonas panacihumi]